MSMLVIDDALKAACDRVREHAHRIENWYRIPGSDWIPGDRPEHVIMTPTGQKIVFSVTFAPAHGPRPFRFLSVSTVSGRPPHPVLVWTIADLLGFTGAEREGDAVVGPGRWACGVNEDEQCVIVQEPIEDV